MARASHRWWRRAPPIRRVPAPRPPHAADHLGGDLGLAAGLELAHDRRYHLFDALGIDRAFAQRDLDRAHQLVAIKRHPTAVALDHGELTQLHALEGGEAEIAGDADAAP